MRAYARKGFAIARHRDSAILLISAVRVGVYCACVCVFVCVLVCENGPGMFPNYYDIISDCNEAFLRFFFVVFFLKTSNGRTDGWKD